VLFHHGARGDFFGALAVTTGTLSRLSDVFVLALLFAAGATQMLLVWHIFFLAGISCRNAVCFKVGINPKFLLASGKSASQNPPAMKLMLVSFSRVGALLAINLLFIMMWGFAGLGKVLNGMPSWFESKFGSTILARVPGLTISYWMLTASELLALLLALIALLRGEFVGRFRPTFLSTMLVWSLFVFVQLAFGQWLTADFNGAFQIVTYFGITLLTLHFVKLDMTPRGPLVVER
jgi:hypothetical protein